MATVASINTELQRLDKQLQEIRVTAEDYTASLADKPDDQDLVAALDELEASEAAIHRQMGRLQRARSGLERRDTAAERAARAQRMAEDAKTVTTQGTALERLGGSILDALDKLRPLLTQYDEVSQARGALAHSLLKEGPSAGRYGPLGPSFNAWERYRRAASQRDGAVGLAITATLWQLFGRGVGQELTSLVDIPGPNQTGPFNERADIRSTMKRLLDRDAELLQAGIDRVLASVAQRDEEGEQA